MLISTGLMVAIYASAATGSTWAMTTLLKMTLPPFNVAARLMEPVSPDDLERGGQMLDFLLLVAWAQIGMISALVVAGLRAALARKPA